MWIRSQDREKLVNCKGFYIRKFSDLEKKYHINKNQSNYAIADELQGSILGYYSTKEKALKVMDMIHRQLIFHCTEKYEIVRPVLKNDQWEPYYKKNEAVFQMPEDSEL